MQADSALVTEVIPGNMAHTSGTQDAWDRVVLHATVSECVDGGAHNTGVYFQSPNAGGLAQYVTDPSATVQCREETTVCWHAPPNERSVGIEMCDPQTGDPARWADPAHAAMLKRTAALVADICHRRGIPLVRLSVADLRAGKRGICGHIDVAQAFGQSNHTDPEHAGAFPWDHFMSLLTDSGVLTMDAEVKQAFADLTTQINKLGALLEGKAKDDDPTHVALFDLDAKLNRLLTKAGA